VLGQKLLSFALLGADWVLWLLIGLSVVCMGIAIERTLFGAMNRTPRAPLDQALAAFLKGGEPPALAKALGALKGIEARVLLAGIEAAIEGGAEASEEAITGTLMFERMRLERGLIVLGTVGANAPFIGLFGTVLGIIRAFHELAKSSAEAAASVMTGISEALVATAIGLVVAIPAVVLYNTFQRRNKDLLARVESLAHLMLARIKGRASTQDMRGGDTDETETAGRRADLRARGA
jgi:biopolymer transport protein ExbB